MELRNRILILSIAVAVLLIIGIHLFHYLPDDTYITLRYARNVLRGDGFVFNEGERLEGYTNFLWLLIIVLLGKLGGSLLSLARTLSFVFSAGTLLLSGYAARGTLPRQPPCGWNDALSVMLPPMVLAASAPFLTWSLSGTEIPLFTFLLLLGFILLRNGKRPGAVFAVFGLLGLVRPEGLIFYALAGLILLARSRRKADVLLGGGGILALFYVPYLIWKLYYFGALLPNTFYAKTGPFALMLRNGSKYLLGFLAC
ncbi:MAG: hypothetical protein KAX38_02645, partial [Candidatus Krumholzibacteria bacterium]|nr:hypothetical protein [Candidatus Krumholzibacteria bacterium]